MSAVNFLTLFIHFFNTHTLVQLLTLLTYSLLFQYYFHSLLTLSLLFPTSFTYFSLFHFQFFTLYLRISLTYTLIQFLILSNNSSRSLAHSHSILTSFYSLTPPAHPLLSFSHFTSFIHSPLRPPVFSCLLLSIHLCSE